MDPSNLRERFLNQNLKVIRRPTPKQPKSPYLTISLKVLMVEERLTFPMHLKVSEGEKAEIKYFPYFEEGEVLQRTWVESLERLGIEQLYFHEKDLARAVAYLNNHLLLASNEPGHQQEKFCILREHLFLSLHRVFQSSHLGANLRLAKDSLGKLANFIGQNDFPWKHVCEMLYRDYTLYSHSVNVAVLGMALMVFLNKSERDVLSVGLAGLFHDLGLTCLSEELVQKVGPLNPEEREILKKHSTLGYRLLKSNAHIPVDTLHLILEHHENADGSGYPQGLALSRQHPHTRILCILEAYDGLTTFRPHRPAQTPYVALKIIHEQQGARGMAFEPATLKNFIQFLALA